MAMTSNDQPSPDLPVGHPSRTIVGRAVVASVACAAIFTVFTWATKELYRHEPWRDDPYDLVVSFLFVLVPLLTVVALARVPLCRRGAPLPRRRAADIVLALRIVVGTVILGLASDWTSIVLGAHRADWSTATAVLVGMLTVVTASAMHAGQRLHRARRSISFVDLPPQPDWLADAVLLADDEAAHLGRWHAPARRAIRLVDDAIVPRVRAHPVASVAVFSVLLGAVSETPQVVLERYAPGLAVLVVAISASTLFGSLIVIGAHLRLVERTDRPSPRWLVAAVAACLAVPVSAAFRTSLWWTLGTTDRVAGVAQLAQLVALSAAIVGLVAYAGAPLARRRRLHSI